MSTHVPLLKLSSLPATGFNCTEAEIKTASRSISQKAWQALRAKVDEQTADAVLAARLRDIFEDGFRYDEKGTPRIWKPEDDIDGIFRKARDDVSTIALNLARQVSHPIAFCRPSLSSPSTPRSSLKTSRFCPPLHPLQTTRIKQLPSLAGRRKSSTSHLHSPSSRKLARQTSALDSAKSQTLTTWKRSAAQSQASLRYQSGCTVSSSS